VPKAQAYFSWPTEKRAKLKNQLREHYRSQGRTTYFCQTPARIFNPLATRMADTLEIADALPKSHTPAASSSKAAPIRSVFHRSFELDPDSIYGILQLSSGKGLEANWSLLWKWLGLPSMASDIQSRT
jgi:hypothetical protein